MEEQRAQSPTTCLHRVLELDIRKRTCSTALLTSGSVGCTEGSTTNSTCRAERGTCWARGRPAGSRVEAVAPEEATLQSRPGWGRLSVPGTDGHARPQLPWLALQSSLTFLLMPSWTTVVRYRRRSPSWESFCTRRTMDFLQHLVETPSCLSWSMIIFWSLGGGWAHQASLPHPEAAPFSPPAPTAHRGSWGSLPQKEGRSEQARWAQEGCAAETGGGGAGQHMLQRRLLGGQLVQNNVGSPSKPSDSHKHALNQAEVPDRLDDEVPALEQAVGLTRPLHCQGPGAHLLPLFVADLPGQNHRTASQRTGGNTHTGRPLLRPGGGGGGSKGAGEMRHPVCCLCSDGTSADKRSIYSAPARHVVTNTQQKSAKLAGAEREISLYKYM